MFRMSSTRTARAGRLSGVAIISVGLMLAGANAASAGTHEEALKTCEGFSIESQPGRPSQHEICMQVNDTDWQARNDNYQGGPHECDGLPTEAPPGQPSSRDLCLSMRDNTKAPDYEGSPSNPLPRAQAPAAKPAPKAAAKPKASKAPVKKKSTKATTKAKAGKR